MRSQTQHRGLEGWQRLAGTWATKATHPALPGITVTGQALQLYVAHTRSCEVHIAANHPAYGRGTDTRQQADPASTS